MEKQRKQSNNVIIRDLKEEEIDKAEKLLILAFSPDTLTWAGTGNFAKNRFYYTKSIAAELDGELVGINFATIWGSFGYFGPLGVHPKVQSIGIGQKIVEATVEYFKQVKVSHAALYTLPTSPKHIYLYVKFGFEPRMLTVKFQKDLEIDDQIQLEKQYELYSESENPQQFLENCSKISNGIYKGLDHTIEIKGLQKLKVGDTLLTGEGFAICHYGKGCEFSKPNQCWVKFGAAKDSKSLEKLIIAVEEYSKSLKLEAVLFGVNTGRHNAYRQCIGLKYKIISTGVIMEQSMDINNQIFGYNHRNIYVLDHLT